MKRTATNIRRSIHLKRFAFFLAKAGTNRGENCTKLELLYWANFARGQTVESDNKVCSKEEKFNFTQQMVKVAARSAQETVSRRFT